MQDRPICFRCTNQIDTEPIFEAPCGHERCPSVVFHALCLMEWRDQRAQAEPFQAVLILVRPWFEEHTENS